MPSNFDILRPMKWFKRALSLRSRNKRHRNSKNQITKSTDLPEYPSLNFAFDLTKDFIAAQLQSTDGLDAKANFAIGAATTVVSAALILQSLLLPSHAHSNCSSLIPGYFHTLPTLLKQVIPFSPLLLTYIGAVILAFFSYRASNLLQAPAPSKLLENIDKTEQEIKPAIFRAMVEAYKLNNEIINRKALFINWSLGFFVVETLSLVLLVLYQVGC